MAAGAKAGADLSARTAQATKLRADIVLLQRSVASAKKEFGPHVYDAMVSGNQSEIDRLFADVKAKVQGLEAQIEAKRQAVADLKVPASARGSGWTVGEMHAGGSAWEAGGTMPAERAVGVCGLHGEIAPPLTR